MKGLWHLDRHEFDIALQYLTHPSLIPTFPDEILELLVQKSGDDLSLALAYYHNVQPALTLSSSIKELFRALAHSSVTSAFYFTRAQPLHTRRYLFEYLISLVLKKSLKDKFGERGVELVGLPLDGDEEGWFEEYLTKGEGNKLTGSKDTLLMRRIGLGAFEEALGMKEVTGRSLGGLNWRVLAEGIRDGLGPRVST